MRERNAHLDAVHAHIHSHKRDEALSKELPNDLPNAPKPSYDDMASQLLRLPLCGLQRLQWVLHMSVMPRLILRGRRALR